MSRSSARTPDVRGFERSYCSLHTSIIWCDLKRLKRSSELDVTWLSWVLIRTLIYYDACNLRISKECSYFFRLRKYYSVYLKNVWKHQRKYNFRLRNALFIRWNQRSILLKCELDKRTLGGNAPIALAVTRSRIKGRRDGSRANQVKRRQTALSRTMHLILLRFYLNVEKCCFMIKALKFSPFHNREETRPRRVRWRVLLFVLSGLGNNDIACRTQNTFCVTTTSKMLTKIILKAALSEYCVSM